MLAKNKKMRMEIAVRKFFIVISLFCFAAMATGAVYYVHLASSHHPEAHNSDHCQICQQGLVNKNPAILCPSVVIHTLNENTFTISYANSFSPQIIKFQTPHLRAPPPIS